MKVRNGFVSNSSSSSFIIAVPMGCNTLGQLQDYLFGEVRKYNNPHFHSEYSTDYNWSVSSVASVVFDGISEQDPKTDTELIEEYMSGYTSEFREAEMYTFQDMKIDNLSNISSKDWNTYNEYFEHHLKRLAQNKISRFIESNPECFFYTLSYSDNNGEFESALEHGNLFDNIPHLKVSHH